MSAAAWLGLTRHGDTWSLPVTDEVLAGSGALYGGCATASAIAVGAALSDHDPRWATTHFTGMARLGATVELRASVVAGGRTVTHVAVEARTDASLGALLCTGSQTMVLNPWSWRETADAGD